MPMSLMPVSSSASPASSPRPGAAASLPDDARSWLKAAAGPGPGRLRKAATCQALGTAFLVGQAARPAPAPHHPLPPPAAPPPPSPLVLVAARLHPPPPL